MPTNNEKSLPVSPQVSSPLTAEPVNIDGLAELCGITEQKAQQVLSEANNTEEAALSEAATGVEEEAKPQPDQVHIPGPPPLADLLDIGIEDEIKKEEEDRQKGKIGRFPLSPSQFGGCGRALAIGLAEAVGKGIFPLELIDPKGKRRFTRGYDIEYSMMRQFKKYVPIAQGFGQQYLEMAVTPDGKYVIGGSMDTLFMSSEHMIVDIKSKADYWSAAHSGAFEETFAKIGAMPGVTTFGERAYFIHDIEEFYERFTKDDFISRYFVQLNSYGACDWARAFRSNLFPGVVGISAVALFFENKNSHTMAEIRWAPSRALYEKSIAKMLDIYQWVAIDGKDPLKYKADFTLGTLACRLCPRRANCWGDTRHPYNGPKKKWPVDSNRPENASELEKKYSLYKKALNAKLEHDNLEKELLVEFVASGESKLRFPDGDVYEIKELKTPKPHFELRKSK